MMAFLIGPSHAGKSTLARAVATQFPEIVFVNLDLRVNDLESKLPKPLTDGWPGRWRRSIVVFEEAEWNNMNTVMDVGAGSLQTPDAFEYFDRRLNDLILISAPFEAILARHAGRNAEELRRTEFSSAHLALYSRITNSIDTSQLSEEGSAAQLSSFLRRAFDVNHS
jgi:shikimate kinase